MDNEKLSNALKEAHATAPTNEMVFVTLEFKHPSFRDSAGNPTSIRVVNDYKDLVATLEPVYSVDSSGATITTPGAQVTFSKFAFEITLPPVIEGANKLLTLSIDNVSEELSAQLDFTKGSSAPIEVIYRPYLLSDLSSPQILPPYKFVLKEVSLNAFKLTAQAAFEVDLTNKPFPSVVYTTENFPGLW